MNGICYTYDEFKDELPPREKYYRLLGYNFQQRRQMADMTIAMVARRAKVPAQIIRKFESGNYEIPIHDMLRMLSAIGIEPFSNQIHQLYIT